MIWEAPGDWVGSPCLRQFHKEPKPLEVRRRGRWSLLSQLRLRPRHEHWMARLCVPHRLLHVQRRRLERTLHLGRHRLTSERVSRAATPAPTLGAVAPAAAAAATPSAAAAPAPIAAAAAATAAAAAAAAATPNSAAAAAAAPTAAPAPAAAAWAPAARPHTRRLAYAVPPLHARLASPDWTKPAPDPPQAAAETAQGSAALNEKYAGKTSFVTSTFSLSVGNKEPARQRDET